MKAITALMFVLLTGPAFANSVALIPVEASGVEAAGRVVDGGLRAGVQRTPVLSEKGPVQMSLEEARTSFSCFEEAPDCMAQVGALLGAQSVVWGHLTRTNGQWSLRLKLLDVAQGTIVRETDTDLPDGPAAMERLAQVADAFVRGQELPVVSLVSVDVDSTPSGVLVSVDGRGIGATPARVDLEPGQYELALRAPDGRVVRRDLRVVDAPVRVAVDLAAGTSPDSVPGEGVSTGTILGITTGVVALAGVGLGTFYGLQAREHANDAETAEIGSDRQARLQDDFEQSQLLANVGFGVALAAGAASVYFLVWHDDDSGVAVAPGPGGVLVSGQF